MLSTRPKDYRRAIVLVGEMRDHGSAARLDRAVADLGTTDTVIYSVAFSPVASQVKRGMHGTKSTQSYRDLRDGTSASRSNSRREILPMVNALRDNTASELAELSGGDYMRFSTKANVQPGSSTRFESDS